MMVRHRVGEVRVLELVLDLQLDDGADVAAAPALFRLAASPAGRSFRAAQWGGWARLGSRPEGV